ncbi:hypothetical protein FK178_09705 [Antarcticibacterium arcticum]|uniref:YARHG domain-containing protein n=1 Tax=Antarcticibacterium arcticum TaxID=2585771 RepID=A0A5B8YJR3_9FLAO|nr:hypothetical protein [Antarcticibacterium arcticum]QED37984.1 hypothetical protein FK178_09705 [Antarcticibacterium arcticum]
MMRNIGLIFLFFLFQTFQISLAQATQEEKNLYSWFDKELGVENTRLLNGAEYVEKYRTVNEKNSFFLSGAPITGSVLYEDEWFHGVQMKYNVHENILIVQVESNLGVNIIQLRNENLQRFEFDQFRFININAPGSIFNGFNEVLLEKSQLTLLKKHSLKLTAKTDQFIQYYEFIPRRIRYGYSYNNVYYEFNSRRELASQFPELKELITDFFKNNNYLYKNQQDTFMVNLFKEITGRLSKEESL